MVDFVKQEGKYVRLGPSLLLHPCGGSFSVMPRMVRVSPRRVRPGVRTTLSSPCIRTTLSGIGIGGGIDGASVVAGTGVGKFTDAGAGEGADSGW